MGGISISLASVFFRIGSSFQNQSIVVANIQQRMELRVNASIETLIRNATIMIEIKETTERLTYCSESISKAVAGKCPQSEPFGPNDPDFPPPSQTLPCEGNSTSVSIGIQANVTIQQINFIIREINQTGVIMNQYVNLTNSSKCDCNTSSINSTIDLWVSVQSEIAKLSQNTSNGILLQALNSTVVANLTIAINATIEIQEQFANCSICSNSRFTKDITSAYVKCATGKDSSSESKSGSDSKGSSKSCKDRMKRVHKQKKSVHDKSRKQKQKKRQRAYREIANGRSKQAKNLITVIRTMADNFQNFSSSLPSYAVSRLTFTGFWYSQGADTFRDTLVIAISTIRSLIIQIEINLNFVISNVTQAQNQTNENITIIANNATEHFHQSCNNFTNNTESDLYPQCVNIVNKTIEVRLNLTLEIEECMETAASQTVNCQKVLRNLINHFLKTI
jgi:hypothetical protein